VWGVHGVGGALGVVLLGVLADSSFNPAVGTNGLLLGNSHFFGKQVIAIAISSVWAFTFTYGMLWLINKVTRVKVEEEAEIMGLDEILHGETAYLESL
jgi:Amt family ammonium transporter